MGSFGQHTLEGEGGGGGGGEKQILPAFYCSAISENVHLKFGALG